jgi:membrane protein DedA with SNARE-associated domain
MKGAKDFGWFLTTAIVFALTVYAGITLFDQLNRRLHNASFSLLVSLAIATLVCGIFLLLGLLRNRQKRK